LPKYAVLNKSDSANSSSYYWAIYRPDGSEFLPKLFVPSNNDPYFNLGVVDFKNDTGDFWICVWALTEGLDNCYDSVCKKVNNTFQTEIDIPNVFTPNGDGINDVFNIKIKGDEVYDLKIWNRWGGKVFESTDSKVLWNGKTNNTGEDNPEGTYYFVFKYQLRGKEEVTVRGTITLLRD
jgi:gliding motility-associated-like protein